MDADGNHKEPLPSSSMYETGGASSKSSLKPAWGRLLQSSKSSIVKKKKKGKKKDNVNKYACLVCMDRKGGKFASLANKEPKYVNRHINRQHKHEEDYDASTQILRQDNEKVVEKINSLSYNPFSLKESTAPLRSLSSVRVASPSPVPEAFTDDGSAPSCAPHASPPCRGSELSPIPSSSQFCPIPAAHCPPESAHASSPHPPSPVSSSHSPTSTPVGSAFSCPASPSPLLNTSSSPILRHPSSPSSHAALSPSVQSDFCDTLFQSHEGQITKKRSLPSLHGGTTKRPKGVQQNLTKFFEVVTEDNDNRQESELCINSQQYQTLYNQNKEILKIVTELRHKPTEDQTKKVTLYPNENEHHQKLGHCNNFKDLEKENLIEILTTDKGLLYVCPTCYKCPAVQRNQSRKFGTLYSGVIICHERLVELRKGGCQKWRSFKNTIQDHMKSDLHLQALCSQPAMKVTNKATENIIRAAINTVKTKAAARQFEANISFIAACGGEVGEIGHSRFQFNEILKSAAYEVRRRYGEILNTARVNTCLPPFFYITADKATVNRKTNQAVMVCFVYQGERISVPAGAPLVYEEQEGSLVGGGGAELSSSIIECLQQNLNIPRERLRYIGGATCDGQYIASRDFALSLREGVGCTEDSDFNIPVTWDNAHLINLAFTDVRDGKGDVAGSSDFIARILNRSAVFNAEMNRGKAFQTLQMVASASGSAAHAPSAYAKQRFTSSSFKMLLSILECYDVYVQTYFELNPRSKEDEEEELKYKICGQDYVLDLICLCDLMKPIIDMMVRVQSLQVPIWKVVGWGTQVLTFIQEVDLDSCKNMSMLATHEADVKDMKFKGIDLLPGYLVVSESKAKDSVISEGGRRKKPTTVHTWVARDVEDVMEEVEEFKHNIVKSLRHRLDRGVHKVCRTLYECVDLTLLMSLMVGERLSEGQTTPYNRRRLAQQGREEFQELVNHISRLPQIGELKEILCMDEELFVDEIFTKLKNCLASIIWDTNFQSVGIKIFNNISTGQNIVVSNDSFVTKFVDFEDSSFSLDKRFTLKTSDGNEFKVTINEKNLYYELFENRTLIQMIGREASIVLDFTFNMGGSEAIAESYYRVMETQRFDGGQSNEILDMRTLIDWSLPNVVACPNTVSRIASSYRSKNHRSPNVKNKINMNSKVIKRQIREGANSCFD